MSTSFESQRAKLLENLDGFRVEVDLPRSTEQSE